MLIRDVMTKSLVTVPVDATIRDAARALVEHDISAAPVIDDSGAMVGIVSEIDLVRRDVLPDQRAHARRVRPDGGTAPRMATDVMTREVVTVPPSADVADAVALMSDLSVKSLPVLDDGRLVGIIARRDVVRVLLRDDDLIRTEVTRRLAEALPNAPWPVRVTDGEVELGAGAAPRWDPVAATVAATVPGVVRVVVGDGGAPRPADGNDAARARRTGPIT